jgi:threonine/homoserine/homoserine lactone efflux protein
MSLGLKAGLYIMIGVVLAVITWGTIGIIGVSAILALNSNAIIFIKLFGDEYLMYLSLSVLKKAINNSNF